MKEKTLNVMDLFAGIGGASYAGKLIGNWRTVCYVEWDDYCQRVIKQRIRDGIFDDALIWDDIGTFDGRPWCGSVDIITAGFPCQPFSVAGKRKGADDERNMWPETVRVISEVRSQFAFLENVPALITSGYYGRIIGDLAEIGYDCRWTIVSAADVGAPHLRKRLWILAYPGGARPETQIAKGRNPDTNNLSDCIRNEQRGSLSPMWVEWLMGYPIGATDLKDLGIVGFRSWLRLHGKS